ncbi:MULTISPECIES: DUF2804 domain-containing protein [unclassified Dietzia]|uniref:DUF2804 domain-containing protein n=1 Tax=unclassified Dietzia TaxID=2617939 RepID=UPI0015FDF1EA|nr:MULTISPECIES: DUF2804 domain-containing protein [unclassified Dietzia]MBB1031046.1 DUF2804 domain-containing protein [Dietzia sp. SLG310A2-38A2]MBB1054435.1 DUF2804 domain-containing protein [Dietzia sp. B44]
MTDEREIIRPTDLARGRRLDPAAVGWTRTPLHRTAIAGWGRTKRWEYWGIVTDRFVVGLTVAGLDYLSTCAVYVLDRRTGVETTRSGINPLARPAFSDEAGVGTVHASAGVGSGRVGIEIDDDDEGATAIRVRAPGLRVDLDVLRPGHDSLGVVVPWTERRFQYTLKDLANPVTGSVTLDGIARDLGTGWAVLDRGRGRWRYATRWNWGAGSGVVDGVPCALQVGGRWTDGTGSTENGILVDGRLHKISEDLHWTYDLADPAAAWRVRGERLDATLTPFHLRRDITELGILAVRTHQAFGTWSGTGVLDDGTAVRLDGLTGWAEESRNRW